MAKPEESHKWYLVESCDIDNTSGRRSKRHIRPCSGQGISTNMLVRCPREMRTNFKLGTKFKIWAKLTDREGGENFLSSWHGYKYYHENEHGFAEDNPKLIRLRTHLDK